MLRQLPSHCPKPSLCKAYDTHKACSCTHTFSFSQANKDGTVAASCTAAALMLLGARPARCGVAAAAAATPTCGRLLGSTKYAPHAALFTLRPHSTHTPRTHSLSQLRPQIMVVLIVLHISAMHGSRETTPENMYKRFHRHSTLLQCCHKTAATACGAVWTPVGSSAHMVGHPPPPAVSHRRQVPRPACRLACACATAPPQPPPLLLLLLCCCCAAFDARDLKTANPSRLLMR